jgi:hypothetical protein
MIASTEEAKPSAFDSSTHSAICQKHSRLYRLHDPRFPSSRGAPQ